MTCENSPLNYKKFFWAHRQICVLVLIINSLQFDKFHREQDLHVLCNFVSPVNAFWYKNLQTFALENKTKLMMSCLSWSCLIKYNPRVFCCCCLTLGQSGQWNQPAYLSPQQASMRSAASPGVAGRGYSPLPHPKKPVYARYSTDTHIWNNDYTPRSCWVRICALFIQKRKIARSVAFHNLKQ